MNLISLIISDLQRYIHAYDSDIKVTNPLLMIAILAHNPNSWFSILFRLESYFFNHSFILFKLIGIGGYPFYFLISYFIFDIHISPHVQIGPGLYMHYRGIIVANSAKIGKNLTVYAPITIGADIFTHDPAPQIGDDVIICTGSRIIGAIKVGNKSIIGANSVVVKDVPEKVIVGGIPAKILKDNNKY